MAAGDAPLLNRPRDPEWQRINREEAEEHRRANMALSMSQRLELGQRLSTQAVELLAAAHRAGLGPRRTADDAAYKTTRTPPATRTPPPGCASPSRCSVNQNMRGGLQ